eukprot:jgi/Botrbrau1/4578/Bobra.60_2s0064.1
MQPWICVAATSADGEIAVWNGETGVGMPSLKGNASGPNCLVPCGTDYLLVAQCNKPAINVWSWPKDQVLHRCFIAESMRAVACTACGTYVAGGGASGTLYLWNAASGALLTSLPSHFKAITALCFDDGGSVVVSGGEDTLVQAFLLPDLLSPACHRAQNAAPSPLHSWSVHTLAVTALCCGAGLLNPILLTASMDRSCHIFSLATGAELKAVHLPASLHSLALDAGEHAAYVGGNDGRIFEISLVGCPRDGREGDARAAAAAVSPGGSSQQLPEEVTALEGHSGCVHSLSLSPGRRLSGLRIGGRKCAHLGSQEQAAGEGLAAQQQRGGDGRAGAAVAPPPLICCCVGPFTHPLPPWYKGREEAATICTAGQVHAEQREQSRAGCPACAGWQPPVPGDRSQYRTARTRAA